MTISSRLTSGAASPEAGSELVGGALMPSLLSSARSAGTARPRSAARRAAALRHARNQIISGLEIAVQLLDQFGKSVVGDSGLDPHRLERFISKKFPYNLSIVFRSPTLCAVCSAARWSPCFGV